MENSKSAREAYRDGEYVKAGDYYTQAAYSAFAHDSITKVVDGQIAGGLYYLLQASYGYRRGQQLDRAKNRCKQGILIASDIRENKVEETVRVGILWEYIGDFRFLGEICDPIDAYEKAATKYSSAEMESSFSWSSNPLIDRNVTFLTWLHRESDTSVPTDQKLDYNSEFRISYKKQHMGTLIDSVCDS